MPSVHQFPSVGFNNDNNTDLENLFLTAAEKGEVKALMVALDYLGIFDVNCVDSEGKSALMLAIENRNLDVLEILSHNALVDLSDALLRAVNLQYTAEVRTLCRALRHRRLLPDGLNCRCTNGDIAADVTPAVLAAQLNNYDMLKVLLEYGAEVKDPSSYEFSSKEFTLEHSVGTIAVYQAITSEAYIALTSADPFGRAFELSSKMRSLSARNFEFRFQYEDMATRCERFAADLLSYVRNSEEQLVVMTHDPKTWSREDFHGDFMEPLKVKMAIKHDQKTFVAHPHCQQHLAEHWYSGLTDWRKLSTLKTTAYTCLMMALFPVMSLCYIVAPMCRPGKLLSTPYVRFISDLASQSIFLCMLAIHFVDFVVHPVDLEIIEDSSLPSEFTSILPTQWEAVIILFIIAHSLKCFGPMLTGGLHWLKDNSRTKIFDAVTLIAFWAWIILRVVAAYQAYFEHNGAVVSPTNSSLVNLNTSGYPSEVSPHLNGSTPAGAGFSTDVYLREINRKLDLVLQKDEKLDAKFRRDLERQKQPAAEKTRRRRGAAARPVGRSSSDTEYQSQYSPEFRMETLPPGHPVIVSKGVLAIAKVFSFLRIVRMTVILLKVGPMQISFGRMGGDIMKFMTIFILILVAFAVGLTELYHLYGEDMLKECMEHSNPRHCRLPYVNFQSSIISLFWALFGMTDLRSLDVLIADHWVTEFIGHCLFAVYHVIAIVALLNILIAMMSNTYNKIEEDADIQWKYSRTNLWMSYYEESSSVAPPFNLLPRLSWLKSCIKCECTKEQHSKQIEILAMDRKYKTLAKELVHRYFFDKKTMILKQRDASQDTYLTQMKGNIASFKYNVLESLLTIGETVADVHQKMAVDDDDDCPKMKTPPSLLGNDLVDMMMAAIEEQDQTYPRFPVRPESFVRLPSFADCPIIGTFPYIDEDYDIYSNNTPMSADGGITKGFTHEPPSNGSTFV